MAPDVLVGRELGEGSLELLSIQIQGVVIHVLGSIFKCSKQEVDFAQVSTKSASGSVPTMAAGCSSTYPLPSSMTMAPSGILSAMLDAESSRTLISSLVK